MDSRRWQYGYLLSTITLVITVGVFIVDSVSTQRTNVVRQQMIENRMGRLEASNNTTFAIMRAQNDKISESIKEIYFKLSDKIDDLQKSINHR